MLVCLSCNPHFQRRADHLHRLGSRAVGESLAELVQRHCIEGGTAARLDEWRRRLTPEPVAAPGGLSPGVPSVPDIGPDGRHPDRKGKKLWRPIISFSAPGPWDRRQRTVLAALTAAGIGGAP
jgi:hypothetical protein